MASPAVKTPASGVPLTTRLLTRLKRFALLWADESINLLVAALSNRAYLLAPLLRG